MDKENLLIQCNALRIYNEKFAEYYNKLHIFLIIVSILGGIFTLWISTKTKLVNLDTITLLASVGAALSLINIIVESKIQSNLHYETSEILLRI